MRLQFCVGGTTSSERLGTGGGVETGEEGIGR